MIASPVKHFVPGSGQAMKEVPDNALGLGCYHLRRVTKPRLV